MKQPCIHTLTPKPARFGRASHYLSRALSDIFIWHPREVSAYRRAIQAGLQQWRINTPENADVFVRGNYMFLTFPRCMQFILEFDACSHLPYPPPTLEVLEARMAALRLLYSWMHYEGVRVFGWRVYVSDLADEMGVPGLCIDPTGFKFHAPDLEFEAREGTAPRKLDDLRSWSIDGPSAEIRRRRSCNLLSNIGPFSWP